MKLLIILATTLALSLSALAQSSSHKVADALGANYIGGNQLAGEHPKGYEDFLVLWVDNPAICRKDKKITDNIKENLYPDSKGKIEVCGRVVFKGARYPQGGSTSDGKYLSYEFKEAYLIDMKGYSIGLLFDTKVVEGISYRFEGVYFENGEEQSNGSRIHLEGMLSKFMNDKKVSETKLRFSPYSIIE